MIGLAALERFLAPIAKLASCLLARNHPARIAAAPAVAEPIAPANPQSVVEAVNEVLFPPAREPQVAGFEMRIVPQDFRLAARLASVAHLNTRAGRIPRKAHQASDAKPMPTASVGAKKQRAADAGRCLNRRKAARPSAKIIPFPHRGRVGVAAALRAAA